MYSLDVSSFRIGLESNTPSARALNRWNTLNELLRARYIHMYGNRASPRLRRVSWRDLFQ